MAELALRVRPIGGEHLDVTYDTGDGLGEAVDRVIVTLAEDNGVLRCSWCSTAEA
jgi:hypothetical protein